MVSSLHGSDGSCSHYGWSYKPRDECVTSAVLPEGPHAQSKHDLPGPRRFGDRRGAGVVLPCLGVGVAVGVVTELTEDPGAQDDAKPGSAGVDLSVRVPAKMVGHRRPELGDLGVEGLQDRDLSGHDRRVGRLHRG
jgi:hypothetical protein